MEQVISRCDRCRNKIITTLTRLKIDERNIDLCRLCAEDINEWLKGINVMDRLNRIKSGFR